MVKLLITNKIEPAGAPRLALILKKILKFYQKYLRLANRGLNEKRPFRYNGGQLSGLASGFDWNSMVDQLTDLERLPQKRLLAQQAGLFEKKSTYSSLSTELNVLKGKLESLAEGDVFDQRSVGNSDETVATSTVEPSGLQGSYTVNVSQMASASTQVGTSNVGSNLNATSDVSSLTLSNAAFSTTVTDGYFTVNNTQITISSSDTLGSVLTSIQNAIGGSSTAVYNPSNDKIEVDGNGTTIVFGSSTDTSNFLQVRTLQ